MLVLQGCIAEQGIHHTCGMSHLECLTHKMAIAPDQSSTPVRHITDSPITCTHHNGVHHTHQHHALAAPPQHYHTKSAAPPPAPKNSSSPQWSTHSRVGKVTLESKPSKTLPQKQSHNVEYVYSSPVDGASTDPQHRHRYVSTPIDGVAQHGVVEVPYQQYRLLHHPVQYVTGQHMPPGAPLVQSSQQAFMSCAHGSYGDVLYATEHYRRMCNQSEAVDKQYQQFHLVKHMYNVPMTHANVMYASNDSPTFINSGMIPDYRADQSRQHGVEGAPRTSPPVCESPNSTRHLDVSKSKSKSMSSADYGNTSSRRRSSSSNRTSSSNRSTPESPILHRVDKRRSLAGKTILVFTL